MINTDEKVVFVGAARTPIGAYLGDLKTVSVQQLGVVALEAAIERANINKEDIGEVIVGHVIGNQTSSNLGRVISLDAGLPITSTGMTVNRICGSGIQSAINAAQQIILGQNQVVAAGGAESLSRSPFYLPESVRYEGLKMGNHEMIDANVAYHTSANGDGYEEITHMGITAENIVERFGITREAQDAFAADSQRKVTAAVESGRMAEEITPVTVQGRKGKETTVTADGHPRPGTTVETLAKLKPAFRHDGEGSVTAGNSSGLNDGAAFEILTSQSYAEEHHLDIMGTLVDYAVVGCSPAEMGLGPVNAIKQILKRNDLTLSDIDILEVNEAFAGQTLGVLEELGIDTASDFYKNNFNPNGGAVAIGHPLGMSGARLITTILYEFKKRPNAKYAIASACIGGGQGTAVLIKK